MKKIVSVFVALLCCFSISACFSPSPNTSKAGTPSVQMQRFQLIGTIVYEDLEGGFYTLIDGDGQFYTPINLDEKYKKDGLKVKVTAIAAEDMMGIHMRGKMITIQSITSL